MRLALLHAQEGDDVGVVELGEDGDLVLDRVDALDKSEAYHSAGADVEPLSRELLDGDRLARGDVVGEDHCAEGSLAEGLVVGSPARDRRESYWIVLCGAGRSVWRGWRSSSSASWK